MAEQAVNRLTTGLWVSKSMRMYDCLFKLRAIHATFFIVTTKLKKIILHSDFIGFTYHQLLLFIDSTILWIAVASN